MKTGKIVVIGLIAVGGALIGGRFWQKGSAPIVSAPTPTQTLKDKITQQSAQKIDSIRQTIRTQPEAGPRAFDRILPEIWTLHLSVNREDSYEELAKDLISQPAVIADLKSVLLDLAATKQRFGDQQAQARIVAVDLLASLVKLGHPEYLLETQTALNKARVLGENYVSKQDIDRLDLLRSYIIAKGPTLLDDIPKFLSETGFVPELAKEYDELLWVWLKSRMDKEELRRKLVYFDQYLPNQEDPAKAG